MEKVVSVWFPGAWTHSIAVRTEPSQLPESWYVLPANRDQKITCEKKVLYRLVFFVLPLHCWTEHAASNEWFHKHRFWAGCLGNVCQSNGKPFYLLGCCCCCHDAVPQSRTILIWMRQWQKDMKIVLWRCVLCPTEEICFGTMQKISEEKINLRKYRHNIGFSASSLQALHSCICVCESEPWYCLQAFTFEANKANARVSVIVMHTVQCILYGAGVINQPSVILVYYCTLNFPCMVPRWEEDQFVILCLGSFTFVCSH